MKILPFAVTLLVDFAVSNCVENTLKRFLRLIYWSKVWTDNQKVREGIWKARSSKFMLTSKGYEHASAVRQGIKKMWEKEDRGSRVLRSQSFSRRLGFFGWWQIQYAEIDYKHQKLDWWWIRFGNVDAGHWKCIKDLWNIRFVKFRRQWETFADHFDRSIHKISIQLMIRHMKIRANFPCL